MSTRKAKAGLAKTPSFFDKYASEYDLMTSAAAREPSHRKEVQSLIERFSPSVVLDAGCATGLTCRLFAEAGIKTVGLDRSAAMLEQADRLSKEKRLTVEFVEGEFENLPKSLGNKFDLIVCLANSIGGVCTQGALLRSFRGFFRALAPGGSLVIQMLNYAFVEEGKIRPIRVTEHDGILYARFQERDGRQMILHALRIDRGSQPPTLEVFAYRSESFSPSVMTSIVRKSGFVKIRRFGSLFFDEPFSAHSRDLVMIATRPSR